MSYDIAIHVRAEGCDAYPIIARPEYDTPTYNLGKLFRACMDWDYSQSEKDEEGNWHTVYYPCDFVIERVEHGIEELILNTDKYTQYEPSNGWGSLDNALICLLSLRKCIYEQSEEIPMNCLYMSW